MMSPPKKTKTESKQTMDKVRKFYLSLQLQGLEINEDDLANFTSGGGGNASKQEAEQLKKMQEAEMRTAFLQQILTADARERRSDCEN